MKQTLPPGASQVQDSTAKAGWLLGGMDMEMVSGGKCIFWSVPGPSLWEGKGYRSKKWTSVQAGPWKTQTLVQQLEVEVWFV